MSLAPERPLFRLTEVRLENFRCFERLQLRLEPDLTVLYAENGGGKTIALRGLAALLGGWFAPIPKAVWSSTPAQPIVRQVRTPAGAWEAAGVARLEAEGQIAGEAVSWSHEVQPGDGKRRTDRLAALKRAAAQVLKPGQPWPLLARYGTQRLWGENRLKKAPQQPFRRQGYTDCLDPRSSEGALLAWIWKEAIADDRNRREGRPLRGFEQALCQTLTQATPEVSEVYYDLGREELRVVFLDGREAGWYQLSDGYHVFMGLVADIAWRSVLLNDHLGARAPELVEGVVLIDEIDLHLHPRWQVSVLDGLRRAFPRLQFVVSTHSALVLSSAENRQIRSLVGFEVSPVEHHVDGRDANSIYRESFGAGVRAARGERQLQELHHLIDSGERALALSMVQELRQRWGALDADLTYAEALLGWGEE